MSKFCSNCGSELESGITYCGNCGAPINSASNDLEKKDNNSEEERYSTGFTVGLLSIPCGLLIAISGWILGIIGIVINIKNKDKYDTKVGLILSIIGLVLSVLNSFVAVIINFDEIIEAYIF